MTCPLCLAPGVRAIYLGVPVWLCLDEECGGTWGFWGWLPALIPIRNIYGNYVFLAYDHTRMSWWEAFGVWWKGEEE